MGHLGEINRLGLGRARVAYLSCSTEVNKAVLLIKFRQWELLGERLRRRGWEDFVDIHDVKRVVLYTKIGIHR